MGLRYEKEKNGKKWEERMGMKRKKRGGGNSREVYKMDYRTRLEDAMLYGKRGDRKMDDGR